MSRKIRFVVLCGLCDLILSGFFCPRLTSQNLGNSQLASGPFPFPFRHPLGLYARDSSDCNPAPGETTGQCLSIKSGSHAEQGLFNFLASFFDGSKAGAYYGPDNVGDPTGPGIATGLIPLNYLQMYDIDIEYANANACDIPGGSCTQNEVTNGTGNTSLQSFQSELETAAAQIQQIADPAVP